MPGPSPSATGRSTPRTSSRLDAVELLPELADHYDEPFGDPSAIPTFRVAQIASQHVKVVLTGDGGDESFGGYSRYRSHQVFGALDVLPSPILRAAARSGRAGHDAARWPVAHPPADAHRRRPVRPRARRALRPAHDHLQQVRTGEPAARPQRRLRPLPAWTSSATGRRTRWIGCSAPTCSRTCRTTSS